MFGAPAQSSLFGAPQPSSAPSLFGAASSSAPLFGASSPPAAQQRPAFGAAPAPAFGAAAPAPSAFGAPAASVPAFGQPAQQGAFGAAPSAGLFGQSAAAPATGGFGQPSGGGLFGSTTPAGGGGLFGSASSAPAFGATSAPAFGAAATPAFGAPAAGAFGQPAQKQSAFGAAATQGGGGLFGQSAPAFGQASSAFGQQSAPAFGAPAAVSGFGQASSVFGQSAPAYGQSAGGLFGASTGVAHGQVGAPGRGTAGAKWAVVQENEGNPPQVARYNTISMMPAFKDRSLEELRLEDYLAGNTPGGPGPGAPNISMGQPAAAFGATPQMGLGGTTGGGVFGQSAPAFGQSSSAFGQAPSGFGQGAPAFGQSAPGFGAAAPAAGSFGGSSAFGGSAGQPSGGLFGSKPAQPSTGLFGQPAAGSGGGMLGNASGASSGFGQAATPGAGSAGSLFGAPAASQPSLFGAPQSAQSQPAFGNSQPSLFGQPQAQSQPSLFGAPAAQSAPSAGGGSFLSTGGISGSGLFGSSSSAPSLGLASGGLSGGAGFGTAQPSLFGAPSTGAARPATGGFGLGATPPAAGGLFATPASTSSVGTSTPGLGLSTGSSLFGGSGSTAAPSAGLGAFSSGLGQTGSTLFGGSTGSGLGLSSSALSGGNSVPSLFGTSGSAFGTGGSLFGNAQQGNQSSALLQQQQQQAGPSGLVASLESNPFGTSSLFSSALGSNAPSSVGGGNIGAGGTNATLFGSVAPSVIGAGLGGGAAARRLADQRAGPARSVSRLRTRTRTSALRRGGDLALFDSSVPGPARFMPSTSFAASSPRPWAPGDSGGNPHRFTPRSGSVTVTALERPSRASTLKKLVIKPRRSSVHSNDDGESDHGTGSISPPVSASPFLHAASASKVGTPAALAASRRELRFDTPAERGGGGYTKDEPITPTLDGGLETPNESNAGFGHESGDVIGGPGSYSDYLRGELSASRQANMGAAPAEAEDKSEDEEVGAFRDVASDDDGSNELAAGHLSANVGTDAVANAEHRDDEDQSDAQSVHPISSRTDMYTKPSIEDLSGMSEDALSRVQGFTVGIEGIGMVEWPGETDVRYLNLDRDVSIKSREVVVYPDDDTRPEVGSRLNKPARVSLVGLWKRDRRTKEPLKDASGAAAMVKKLKAHCDKEDLTFLGYDVANGCWMFETPHF